MNPFAELYDHCNSGTGESKLSNLPDFPRLIDVEVTNSCNFRCLMCPTGNLSMKRPSGFMAKETFAKIVSQCADHGTAIRFIGWGEPLLHWQIAHFVWLADGAGLLTHINTNASKLTRALATELIKAGLSSLKFSFQGVDRKTYRDMRNIDHFEPLLSTIKMVRDVRGTRDKPWLHVSTSITDETPEMVEFFKQRVAHYVDQVSVGKTIFGFNDLNAVRLNAADKARLVKFAAQEDKTQLRHPDPCPQVYDSLTVQWDGGVGLCCNDHDRVVSLGNVNDTPLAEIWRAPAIEDYRARLAAKDYGGPLCATCWHYMEGTA